MTSSGAASRRASCELGNNAATARAGTPVHRYEMTVRGAAGRCCTRAAPGRARRCGRARSGCPRRLCSPDASDKRPSPHRRSAMSARGRGTADLFARGPVATLTSSEPNRDSCRTRGAAAHRDGSGRHGSGGRRPPWWQSAWLGSSAWPCWTGRPGGVGRPCRRRSLGFILQLLPQNAQALAPVLPARSASRASASRSFGPGRRSSPRPCRGR